MATRARRQFQDCFTEILAAKATVDVASLADAVGASQTVTIPGVALGDVVLAVSHGVSTQGISVTADVTAADTVTVRFQNESGGTLDLASTTLRVIVAKVDQKLFL